MSHAAYMYTQKFCHKCQVAWSVHQVAVTEALISDQLTAIRVLTLRQVEAV